MSRHIQRISKNKYIRFWCNNIAVKTKWFLKHILKQGKNNIIYDLKSSACTERQMEWVAFNSCLSSIRSTAEESNYQTVFAGATWLNSDALRLHGSFLESEGGNPVSPWTDYASYQGKSTDMSVNTGSTKYPVSLPSNHKKEMNFDGILEGWQYAILQLWRHKENESIWLRSKTNLEGIAWNSAEW